MAQESVVSVLEDFRTALNDAVAGWGFVRMGLMLVANFLNQQAGSLENPDPWIFIGDGDPNLPEHRDAAMWRKSEALMQIATDGPVMARFDQQLIVFLFTLWEHEYRGRLALARGFSTPDVTYPIFGDVRRLRNDVVHHHGIATKDNACKCEVLTNWFVQGEVIHLSGKRLGDLLGLIPWENMAATSG
jgi:hypothetical protein